MRRPLIKSSCLVRTLFFLINGTHEHSEAIRWKEGKYEPPTLTCDPHAGETLLPAAIALSLNSLLVFSNGGLPNLQGLLDMHCDSIVCNRSNIFHQLRGIVSHPLNTTKLDN